MFGRPEHPPQDDQDFGTGLPEATGGPVPPYQPERKLSNAALRRELWRDNQQQSVEDQAEIAKAFLFAPSAAGTSSGHRLHHPESAPGSTPFSSEVFKFDSFDRDRYLTRETRSCDDQVKQQLKQKQIRSNRLTNIR
jgi:hypothetical protein